MSDEGTSPGQLILKSKVKVKGEKMLFLGIHGLGGEGLDPGTHPQGASQLGESHGHSKVLILES